MSLTKHFANFSFSNGIFLLTVSGVTCKFIESIFTAYRNFSSKNKFDSRCNHFAIIGDSFADILVGPLQALPQWGQDILSEKPFEIMAGGSALNTAVQMSALKGLVFPSQGNKKGASFDKFKNTQITLHTGIAADYFGTLLLSRLHQTGVKASLSKLQKGDNTGACLVLTGASDRAFVTHRGVVSTLCLDRLNKDELLQAGHVHIAGYYNCPGLWCGLVELLQEVKARGNTVSLCPQWDAHEIWGGLDELYPFLDLLILNEVEAQNISKCMDPTEASSFFLSKGVKIVVITLGQNGSLAAVKYSGKDIVYRQPCKKIKEVVDTTGAGDAFSAGFLYSWKLAGSLPLALEIGSICAACVVAKFGASVTPTSAEMIKLWEQS